MASSGGANSGGTIGSAVTAMVTGSGGAGSVESAAVVSARRNRRGRATGGASDR